MESSLFGTAQAVSLGQVVQAVIPKLQAANSFSNPALKVNLPAEAHEFIERVKTKMDEDPSILSQPASWENLLSFVELSSGLSKNKASKHTKQQLEEVDNDDNDDNDDNASPLVPKQKQELNSEHPNNKHHHHNSKADGYAKKTPIQKIVHLLEGNDKGSNGEEGDDSMITGKGETAIDDDGLVSDVTPASSGSSASKSSPFEIVIFVVSLIVVIGGMRYLSLVLTQQHESVDPIDFIIGTKFTTGAMIAGLVAGFVFSFVDSIALIWTMILLEKNLSNLPGAHEEASFAVYANVISNLFSGAISTSAGIAVAQGLHVGSEQTPFWSQLVGGLLGGVVGVMLAKVIPHEKRMRSSVVNNATTDGDLNGSNVI